MTLVIATTDAKMNAFGAALANAAQDGKAVDLGDVAKTSDTLVGPKVCYETEHYRIVDLGEDWHGRFTTRFALERRPEFAKSRVMKFPGHSSIQSAEALIPSLREAEAFHMSNSGVDAA